MPKKWPPLELREVEAILRALGFTQTSEKGGHLHWTATIKNLACKVTVSPKYAPFDDYLLESMCTQANCTRDEFYNATPKTAKKIR